MEDAQCDSQDESPEERAHRLTEKLRGPLKDEIAAFGGREGFVRWVRGYDDEPTEIEKWIESRSR